jgi:HSP20 family protein
MSGSIRYYGPLERVFGSLLPVQNGDGTVANVAIRLDVVETPEAYVVKAELPGVSKEQIEVSVEDTDVTIGVEFREEVEANGKSLRQERSFGKAKRAIRLPESVNANATQATHVNGVLQLTLPKVAKANSKQITIQ